MFNRTEEDWKRLRELPALLKELPLLAESLGFHFYSFRYTGPNHEVRSGNLLLDGDVIVQAALDFRDAYLQRSDIPLIWEPKVFAKAPVFWSEAQELGLRHGWVQPLHGGATRSYLALFRPHVSLSIKECYQKAAGFMWLTERLHLAALGDSTVSADHAPCVPSRCSRSSGG